MKKIRVLAFLLALVMVFATFAACGGSSEDGNKECPDGKHNWKKEKIEQRRSCTEPEIKSKECRDCGKVEMYETNAASGHKYDDTQKTFNHDATCTEDGHYVSFCYYGCTTPDAVRMEVATGTALGHSYITFVTTADGYSEVAQCVRCTSVTERLLGVKLDMSDRSHISFSTLKVVTPTATSVPADSNFVTVGSETYLRVERAAGSYVGLAEYGVSVSPRADILMTDDYVYQTTVKLDKAGTGDLYLIRGEKSYLPQKLTFVTYKQGNDLGNGEYDNGYLETIDGKVYDLTDADYENGLTVAIVINDFLRIYDVYVNGKLVSQISVGYGADDYFSGLQLASIGTYTVHGNTASSFDVESIYIYNASQPNGFTGATNVGYGIYIAENGERITYKLSDPDCDCDYNNIVKTVEPTCSRVGYTVKSCACGGETIVDETAPIAHKWGAEVTIAPTCTDTGYIVKTCEHCGVKDGEAFGSPAGHTAGAMVENVDPTCLEDGYTDYRCANCNVVYRVEHKALGHALGEEKIEVEATCTSDGYVQGPCVRCDTTYTDPATIVKAYGHFAKNPTKVIKPTCTDKGYDLFTCELCSTPDAPVTYTANEVNAVGHKFYSIEQKDGARLKLITKCINCAHNEEIEVSTTVPSYSVMTSTLQAKLFAQDYNNDSATYTSAGDYNKEAAPYRFTQWEAFDENGDKYAKIITAPSSTVGSGNGHGYKDYAFTKTTAGAAIVIEFDLKFPTELASDEVNGGYELQIGARVGSLLNFTPLTIPLGGDIQIAGTTVGKVTNTDWTKIALVLDPSTRTYVGYINGSKVVTASFPENYTHDFFSEMRMNNNKRHSSKKSIMLFQNFYAYYGDAPVYLSGAAEYEDSSLVQDGSYGNVVLSGDINTKADAEQLDYVVYFDNANTNSKFGYKQHAALKVVTRGEGTNVYKTLNLKAGADVPSIDTTLANGNNVLEGNASNYDSMFWLGNAINQNGSFNVSLDVRFNSTTGAGRLIEGRRGLKTADGKTASGNARFNFITFQNGKLLVNKGDDTYAVIHDIVVGELITIDIFDRAANDNFDVYINGYLVAENINYSGTSYGRGGVASASKTIGDQQYLLFDLWSYVDNGIVDVDVDRIDIFGGKTAPEYYAGRAALDAVIADKQEVEIFNVTDETKITDFISADKVGGMLYLQDGVLTKSALAVTAGNARVTKVGLGGGVDINPKHPGYYTLGFNDLATNGLVNPDIYKVTQFADLPRVDEVTFTYDNKNQVAKNVYDLTKFDSITLKYYVGENTPGYTCLFFIDNPGVAEGSSNNKASYLSYSFNTTPGWHEIEIPLVASKWSASRAGAFNKVSGYFFRFFSWGGTGVDTNGDGKRNESDAQPDGFSFYLNSITLNKTVNVTTEGTSFKTTEICHDHNFGEAVVGKAPTPTDIGYSVETCSVCGYKNVNTLPKVSHESLVETDPDNHVLTLGENNVEASCEADGLYEASCSCGYSVSTVLKKHGHTFVDGQDADHVNVPADCVNLGKEWYVCANENCELDGTRYSIDTPALGHTMGADTIIMVIKPGTENEPDTNVLCTDAKEKWAFGCCVDGCELGADAKWKIADIAATSHSYEKVETKAPDCVNVGYYNDVCTVCDHVVENIEIPALGHTVGDNTVILEVAVGTGETKIEYKNCTDARELWAYGCCVEGCEVGADAMWKLEDIEAGEHTYVKTDAISATCTTAGVQHNVCSHCAYIERDEDAKLVIIDGVLQKPYKAYETFIKDHTPTGDVVYFEQNCVTGSGRTFVCDDCGETITEYNGDEALGHEFGEWITISEVTCGTDGFRDKECSRCDVMYSDTLDATQREVECVTGYATGEHGEYEHKISQDDPYMIGYEYDECTVCGDQKNVVELPALYEGTEGFEFVKGADGNYLLVGYNGEATKLVIPGTYSGKTVVVAFKNAYTNVTEVTVLDGAILADGAFKGWTSLNKVVLPDSVTEIPAYAFSGCTALVEIELPATCTVIKSYAFSGCTNLNIVTVNGTLTKVGQFAFKDCDALYRVVYSGARPDDVIESGNDALFEAIWAKANAAA